MGRTGKSRASKGRAASTDVVEPDKSNSNKPSTNIKSNSVRKCKSLESGYFSDQAIQKSDLPTDNKTIASKVKSLKLSKQDHGKTVKTDDKDKVVNDTVKTGGKRKAIKELGSLENKDTMKRVKKGKDDNKASVVEIVVKATDEKEEVQARDKVKSNRSKNKKASKEAFSGVKSRCSKDQKQTSDLIGSAEAKEPIKTSRKRQPDKTAEKEPIKKKAKTTNDEGSRSKKKRSQDLELKGDKRVVAENIKVESNVDSDTDDDFEDADELNEDEKPNFKLDSYDKLNLNIKSECDIKVNNAESDSKLEKGTELGRGEPKLEDLGVLDSDNLAIPDVKKPFTLPKTVDHNDAMAVLLHMEGALPGTSGIVENDATDLDDDSEEEWEDVEDHSKPSPKKSQTGSVEITLHAPVIYKKKKKRGFDIEDYFRRQINKFKKEVAMDVHKVHLLCLVARCRYLNQLCSSEMVQAQALSVVMLRKDLKVLSAKTVNEQHVTRALSWIATQKLTLLESFKESLGECVSDELRLVLICAILLREVGLKTRVVMSLQPLPFKPTSGKAKSSNKKGKETKSSTSSKKTSDKSSKPAKSSASNSNSTKDKRRNSDEKKATVNKGTVKNLNADFDTDPDKTECEETKSEQDTNDGVIGKGVKSSKGKNSLNKTRRSSSARKCRKLGKNVYKEDGENENLDSDDDEDFVPELDNDADDGAKDKKKGKALKGKKTKKLEKSDTSMSQLSSDSDFEEESILVRTQQLKKKVSPRNTRIRSSSDDDGESRHEGMDYWVEVYIGRDKKWLSIDGTRLQVSKPYELENKATQPVCYIVGISNDGHIKDVTPRYASQWLTETRKLRTDQGWWEDVLLPYRCLDKHLDNLEDEDLSNSLQRQPLPSSIAAFKNHPLYVLKRHLLKFEALYPDSAIPVGYIRGEPVYARECVHVLHSRENWLKEGRAVRIGEEAYKFVKSRPKWNKPKDDPEAKDLEIFGRWQTEEYIPPPAVDGKVPRNAHGNVEMFLPTMLPAGTVHLKISGLNKVAKKLDIDCAPAMIGWDHHCGFSHPLMDGWIVCEEFKDILLAAWDEEQEIMREKEAAKREKRVYDNWRKLVRGLLIKERLKKRFDLHEPPQEPEPKPSTSGETGVSVRITSCETNNNEKTEIARDVEMSWPQNRLSLKNKANHTLCEVEQI